MSGVRVDGGNLLHSISNPPTLLVHMWAQSRRRSFLGVRLHILALVHMQKPLLEILAFY